MGILDNLFGNGGEGGTGNSGITPAMRMIMLGQSLQSLDPYSYRPGGRRGGGGMDVGAMMKYAQEDNLRKKKIARAQAYIDKTGNEELAGMFEMDPEGTADLVLGNQKSQMAADINFDTYKKQEDYKAQLAAEKAKAEMESIFGTGADPAEAPAAAAPVAAPVAAPAGIPDMSLPDVPVGTATDVESLFQTPSTNAPAPLAGALTAASTVAPTARSEELVRLGKLFGLPDLTQAQLDSLKTQYRLGGKTGMGAAIEDMRKKSEALNAPPEMTEALRRAAGIELMGQPSFKYVLDGVDPGTGEPLGYDPYEYLKDLDVNDPKAVIGASLGPLGGYLMTDEQKSALIHFENIVVTSVKTTSGDAFTDEEVSLRRKMLTPSATDGPKAIDTKKQLARQYQKATSIRDVAIAAGTLKPEEGLPLEQVPAMEAKLKAMGVPMPFLDQKLGDPSGNVETQAAPAQAGSVEELFANEKPSANVEDLTGGSTPSGQAPKKRTDKEIMAEYEALPWWGKPLVAADDLLTIGGDALTFGALPAWIGDKAKKQVDDAWARSGSAGYVPAALGTIFSPVNKVATPIKSLRSAAAFVKQSVPGIAGMLTKAATKAEGTSAAKWLAGQGVLRGAGRGAVEGAAVAGTGAALRGENPIDEALTGGGIGGVIGGGASPAGALTRGVLGVLAGGSKGDVTAKALQKAFESSRAGGKNTPASKVFKAAQKGEFTDVLDKQFTAVKSNVPAVKFDAEPITNKINSLKQSVKQLSPVNAKKIDTIVKDYNKSIRNNKKADAKDLLDFRMRLNDTIGNKGKGSYVRKFKTQLLDTLDDALNKVSPTWKEGRDEYKNLKETQSAGKTLSSRVPKMLTSLPGALATGTSGIGLHMAGLLLNPGVLAALLGAGALSAPRGASAAVRGAGNLARQTDKGPVSRGQLGGIIADLLNR